MPMLKRSLCNIILHSFPLVVFQALLQLLYMEISCPAMYFTAFMLSALIFAAFLLHSVCYSGGPHLMSYWLTKFLL